VLSNLIKAVLVATSLAPVLFTLAFLEYRAGNIWPGGARYIGVAILLALICWAVLRAARTQLQVLPFKITSAATADKEVLAFLITYITPLLFAGTPAAAIDGATVTFLVLLFAFVVWGTHAYDFNPLLGVLGYHFYDVTNSQGISYVLISRKHIVNVKDVTHVVQLTEYVVLEKSDS